MAATEFQLIKQHTELWSCEQTTTVAVDGDVKCSESGEINGSILRGCTYRDRDTIGKRAEEGDGWMGEDTSFPAAIV
uniref:Uncharacterized protein n=1 Tax=Arundo donax TaxID=35708 RepID=A0A0A9AV34_ARUDO